MEPTTLQWNDLHPECWVLIFLECTWETICHVTQVCSTFNNLLDSNLKGKILKLSPPYDILLKEEMMGLEPKDSFDDMDLQENLLRGVYAYGFEKPSGVQKKSIVCYNSGFDVLGQAPSGTGKTASYAIGILNRIDLSKSHPQAVVLVPTRELAAGVSKVIESLGNFQGVKSIYISGGTSIRQEMPRMATSHVLVGTPGRMYDHFLRSLDAKSKPKSEDPYQGLDISKITHLVIDEVDEFFARGFEDQVLDIIKLLSGLKQRAVLSATIPFEIFNFAKNFLRNPARIIIPRQELTLEGCRQFYVDCVKEEWKLETLHDLLDTASHLSQCAVFCNTRRKVEWLKDKVIEKGFTVSFITGDMPQADREEQVKSFREGRTRIFILTDLLSRSQGYPDQTTPLIVHYDLPRNIESYLHRTGRSGRYGRRLVSLAFITEDDKNWTKDTENYFNTSIEELPAHFIDLL